MNYGPCTCGCKVFGTSAMVHADGKPWSTHMLTCVLCGKRWLPDQKGGLIEVEKWLAMFSPADHDSAER